MDIGRQEKWKWAPIDGGYMFVSGLPRVNEMPCSRCMTQMPDTAKNLTERSQPCGDI